MLFLLIREHVFWGVNLLNLHKGELLEAGLAGLLLGITEVATGTALLTIVTANSVVTRTAPVLVLRLVVATSVAKRTGVHSVSTDDRVGVVGDSLFLGTAEQGQEGVVL